MDEEAEDRFTELARTRLADTLSEAARMLTGPAADPGDAEAADGVPPAPTGERVGGRGFDDVLLGRTGRVALGLVPAPAEDPPPASGRNGGEAPISLESPVGAEVGELRRQVADLSGQVEHLRTQLRTAVERLAAVAVVTPAPSEAPAGSPAEPMAGPEASIPQAAPVREAAPGAEATRTDGYTWAFTETPRRRFWRRR